MLAKLAAPIAAVILVFVALHAEAQVVAQVSSAVVLIVVVAALFVLILVVMERDVELNAKRGPGGLRCVISSKRKRQRRARRPKGGS